MTASKSRKKHQQEIIYKALEADQLSKKTARENFNFTNLNYLHYASFEPFLFQSKEETEEGKFILGNEIIFVFFSPFFYLSF